MNEEAERFHLETAATALANGCLLFEDLVSGSSDQLVENLYALKTDALRKIVFERVVAERARRSPHE